MVVHAACNQPRAFSLGRLSLVCRLAPLVAAVVPVRPGGVSSVLALLCRLSLGLLLLELFLYLVLLGRLDAVALALLQCRLITSAPDNK